MIIIFRLCTDFLLNESATSLIKIILDTYIIVLVTPIAGAASIQLILGEQILKALVVSIILTLLPIQAMAPKVQANTAAGNSKSCLLI